MELPDKVPNQKKSDEVVLIEFVARMNSETPPRKISFQIETESHLARYSHIPLSPLRLRLISSIASNVPRDSYGYTMHASSAFRPFNWPAIVMRSLNHIVTLLYTAFRPGSTITVITLRLLHPQVIRIHRPGPIYTS